MKIIVTIIVMLLSVIQTMSQQPPPDYLPDLPNARHSSFVLFFNADTGVADWAAYSLCIGGSTSDSDRSGFSFRIDSLVNSPASSLYRNSGYDRGHLVPGEDIPGCETYITSNIAPQAPSLNRGIWKRLENHIRRLWQSGHNLVVITGTIHLPTKYTQRINDKIAIPVAFYKIVLNLTTKTTTAWLIPNASQNDSPLNQYKVPVKNIIKK